MKTKAVEMPDGYEFSHVGNNGEIIIKEIVSKYPLSVREIPNRHWYISSCGTVDSIQSRDINQLSTKERAEAFLALMQLVELRDAWNKIDGFVADFGSYEQDKFCIITEGRDIVIKLYGSRSRVLFFGSEETAQEFLIKFESLIKTAKELI